jgi:hypothetical protein
MVQPVQLIARSVQQTKLKLTRVMPHFLSLLRVRPLEWAVTEYTTHKASIASIKLTGHHMHAQPALIRFKNDSVAVAFFDGEGGPIKSLEQLHPEKKLLDVDGEDLVPEEVVRVPVPHIHRGEINIERIGDLVDHHKPISTYNSRFCE